MNLQNIVKVLFLIILTIIGLALCGVIKVAFDWETAMSIFGVAIIGAEVGYFLDIVLESLLHKGR